MSDLSDSIIQLGTQLENIGLRNTIWSMVSRHGVEFTAGRRTACPEFHVPKQCFKNAYALALAGGLTYVEGYVSVYGVPVHHAWCVDIRKQVVDPTILDPEIVDYFGIPFDLDYVGHSIFETNYYGVLDNDYWDSIYTAKPEEFLALDWIRKVQA